MGEIISEEYKWLSNNTKCPTLKTYIYIHKQHCAKTEEVTFKYLGICMCVISLSCVQSHLFFNIERTLGLVIV